MKSRWYLTVSGSTAREGMSQVPLDRTHYEGFYLTRSIPSERKIYAVKTKTA